MGDQFTPVRRNGNCLEEKPMVTRPSRQRDMWQGLVLNQMAKALQEAVARLIAADDLSSALEAVRILERSHACRWRAVGDREGNYGNINIGSDPGHAFVERVTNAIDAVIEREAARHLKPSRKGKVSIPASPREAVEAWFGVPGGRVANLEARAKKGKPAAGPSRQALADNVVVRILDGQGRKAPSLEVRDLGIGLTSSQFPKTILSLNEQNRDRQAVPCRRVRARWIHCARVLSCRLRDCLATSTRPPSCWRTGSRLGNVRPVQRTGSGEEQKRSI